MSTSVKYTTKEDYLEANRQRASSYYHEHKEERKEYNRQRHKDYYQKNREKILAQKKKAYEESKRTTLPIEDQPKRITTHNFIMEIVN
jgi:hypothetical protein